MPNNCPSEARGLVTFTVKHNNGRDIWLECWVTVTGKYAPDRFDDAESTVREVLKAIAETFPPEWPRPLCDWSRIECCDSRGHVIVRMPAAMARRILEAQEREALDETAS